jgi:hypothetical protein
MTLPTEVEDRKCENCKFYCELCEVCDSPDIQEPQHVEIDSCCNYWQSKEQVKGGLNALCNLWK